MRCFPATNGCNILMTSKLDFLMNFAFKDQIFDDPMLAAIMVSRVVAMVTKAVAMVTKAVALSTKAVIA